jgi:hypothetical protein
MVIGFPAHTHAASPVGEAIHPLPCDHNPNVDPSLRVCVNEQGGVTSYRIETTDGTSVELAMSRSGVEMQQSGPDTVRVLFSNSAVRPLDNMASASGVVKKVYQDDVLMIGEVQDGQHAPTWVIFPRTVRVTMPSQTMCTGSDCSGHIQQQ